MSFFIFTIDIGLLLCCLNKVNVMDKIVKAMLPFSLIFSGCSSYNEMPEDAGVAPNEEYDRV